MHAPTRHEAETTVPARSRILVWDVPLRLFHWLMVACFAGAYLTAESSFWRPVHATLGYTMAGLVVFRLIWGLVGTRYARFSQFVRGARTASAYLSSLLRGQPLHYTGHNPLGALAVVSLLGLTLIVALTGWATLNDWGGKWSEQLHEGLANAMLGLVLLHVVAVIITSRLHHEHLIAAMLHGKKEGLPGEGITQRRRLVAFLLLAAVVGFWWQQLRL
jgi:cytochrome b